MIEKPGLNVNWLVLGATLLLPACEALPVDPENTSQKIVRDRQFTVGLVAGTTQERMVEQLLGEVAKRTHARPRVVSGATEILLQGVSKGKLDLVIGEFTKNSPWQTDVAFGPPLRSSGLKSDPLELKAAMRNGENRWITLVERASRAVSAEARSQ
ncbi:hypothetical protein [Sphingobium yanoikuyae]|uniref:hypothetical protein n=1 Tax=Sphingobium yanoikuyae TaxID=13690 RepID=UPI0022DD0E2E|nr:hypothetical protein [Sphingobium yanoikuyae]WBQ19057.1 hypothetical protein PAE53_24805 [Sphingobium yanoikuyae]